jgi:ABC-type spermidine/putrescine transport system permease subunit II
MVALAEVPYDLQRQSRRALALEPWLYLSPALIIVATVLIVPLIIGISYSLRKFSAFKSQFVGLDQYRTMLGDEVLHGALVNTLWWTIGSLFFQFFLGLGLALLLNRPFYGRKLVQGIVFLPWAVPTFLTGLTWTWLFNPVIGPLPHVFYALGIQSEPVTILADPATAMWGPIIANVWFGIPFFAITLLAARKSIPAAIRQSDVALSRTYHRYHRHVADCVDRHFRRHDLCDDARRACWLHQHHSYLYLCVGLQSSGQGLCLGDCGFAAGSADHLCTHRHADAASAAEGRLKWLAKADCSGC